MRDLLCHALIRLAARIDPRATLRICEQAAHRAAFERLALSIDTVLADMRKHAAKGQN